jgi:serine phosphatase RsbU (regulator of sigma subunit)
MSNSDESEGRKIVTVDSDSAGRDRPRTRRGSPFGPAAGALLMGLVVTGILSWLSAVQYSNNEHRLLRLEAHNASSVLSVAVPDIQAPLASAATLADATNGNRAKFMQLVGPYVGAPPKQFVSLSLWRLGGRGAGPIAVAGSRPILAPSLARQFLHRAARTPTMSVIGLFRGSPPRLGYAFGGPGRTGPFIVYAESGLPRNRYQAARPGAAFSDLNFAIYLGKTQSSQDLLVTSVKRLPLPGQRTSVTIPFGNTFFTLAATARAPLGGSLPQRLPWVIAIAGVLLTLGASILTLRLTVRRRRAERLAVRLEEVAEENRRLFTEQQGIAQTLQRALLPEELPQPAGLQTSARYEPGVHGVEVGGDWYDLITGGGKRLLLVVGDVSGRGLRAATTMAALRYAVHAYAAQGDPPALILAKLAKLVNVRTSGQLATVLCAQIDIESREVSVASAGHLPPLLISNGRKEFVHGPVGLPIGVDPDTSYTASSVTASPGATFLAFTDGLIERRGESIDVGLSRLRETAASSLPLEELLTRLVTELRDDRADDDTAIAAIRWMS